MKEKHELFSYGTLKEPEIQKILFGETVEMQEAVLMNWRAYLGDDGYLFVRQEHGYSVKGCILLLTQEQLIIADRWEDVPSYARVRTSACLKDRGACEVWVYAKPAVEGKPAEHEMSSSLPMEQVIAEAQELKNG